MTDREATEAHDDRAPARDAAAGAFTADNAVAGRWTVAAAPSTAICSGLPVPRGPAHPLSHGHQITRDDLRRIGSGGGRGCRCAVAFVSKGDSDARAGFDDFGDLVGFGNVVGSRPNV